MQQTATRDPGEMSWARAIVLATGFFFLAAIYLGQIPGFYQLASTQATLGLFSQVLLTTALLSGGLALIGITATFLYDPKPLSRIFPLLFGLLGVGLMAAGGALLAFVLVSGHHFLPDQTISTPTPGQPAVVTNWPNPNQSYLFNSIWFQPQSIDLGAVGFVLLMTGGGVFGFAALYGPHSKGKLTGPLRSLLMQLSIGIAAALLLAFLTMYTFAPDITIHSWANGAIYNIALGAALSLVLFATQLWLLPVMTERKNRARFMPALYLHSVMLLGNITVPLLGVFVALYPLVTLLQNLNFLNGYFVQCSSKTAIPASCTFTSYSGYLIAAIVSGMFFTFMLIAGYLWTKKPAFVRLGSLFGYVFAALAVVATHTGASSSTVWPNSVPVAMALAVGVAILGLVWMVTTQREFVPASAMQANLGCVGQWLVMGSALLIYIAAFAFFSFPTFVETEGNLVITPGHATIHDAYWVLLIAGGLAALCVAFLIRRQPMGQIRKLAMWLVLIGGTLQIGASIHFNLQAQNDANYPFYLGVFIEVLGIVAGLWGALMTSNQGGRRWFALSIFTIAIGGLGLLFLIVYSSTLYELYVAAMIFMALGTMVYAIMGADPPDVFIARSATTALPEE